MVEECVYVGGVQFVGGVEDEVWMEFRFQGSPPPPPPPPPLPHTASSYNIKTNTFSCHAVSELTGIYTTSLTTPPQPRNTSVHG